MKRRLYPVVKHGARFALACVAFVAVAFGLAGALFMCDAVALLGEFLRLCIQGSNIVTYPERLIVFGAVCITVAVGPVAGVILRCRALNASKTPTKLLTDSADAIEAG
jgi:hypothetical protein